MFPKKKSLNFVLKISRSNPRTGRGVCMMEFVRIPEQISEQRMNARLGKVKISRCCQDKINAQRRNHREKKGGFHGPV